MKIEYRRHSFHGATDVEVWDANQPNPLKARKKTMRKEYGDVEQFTEKEIQELVRVTKKEYPALASIIVHIWGQEL